jgi:hypothetical protein
MTKARKMRIWTAYEGRCACGASVPPVGKGVEYDHDIQLWMGGPEEDRYVRPLCLECHADKTSADAGRRAKVKALWAKAPFAPRKPSKLKSRGFGPSRPLRRKPDDAETPMVLDRPPPPSRQKPRRPPDLLEVRDRPVVKPNHRQAGAYKFQVGPSKPAPGALLKGALRKAATEKAGQAKNRKRRPKSSGN